MCCWVEVSEEAVENDETDEFKLLATISVPK